MKSPAALRAKLCRQWHSAAIREARLLNSGNAWPIVLSIGRPVAGRLQTEIDAVKRHVEAWRREPVGEVAWEDVHYRAAAEPVTIPLAWKLRKPSEWVAACGDRQVRQEFEALAMLVEQSDPIFHPLLIRRRSLWRDRPLDEVVRAARLASALDPGAARGRSLRMLSVEGIDTKFFQHHAHLIASLLDVRFDGEVSEVGLEAFLDAYAERDHWLLLKDLDGSLLPFEKLRVRSSELAATPPPGDRLLIIENEHCQHQLPAVPGTVAVFGAGRDLQWTSAAWLQQRPVAYWGDIDTWGLQLLAQARRAIPGLSALMMTSEVFDRFHPSAVAEHAPATEAALESLSPPEQALHARLLTEVRGRLEQEFLPAELVERTVLQWASTQPNLASGQ